MSTATDVAGERPAQGQGAMRLGGWTLIFAAFAFMSVFTYLAIRFGYPDVLDGKAADVLPALLAMGTEGRAVWAIYGVLPLLLVPAGLGVHFALRKDSVAMGTAAAAMAGVSAVAMMLGLLRWPSIQWTLAESYASASSELQRAAIADLFAGLNSYLGNFLGEFVGELTMNLFFLFAALGARRSARFPRWSVGAGIAAAVTGLVAMWRNAIPAVAPVSEIENLLLPVWMVILGALLLRAARATGRNDVAA